MLDFDFICKRKQPSVAGIIYTFGGQFVSKMCVEAWPYGNDGSLTLIQVLGHQRNAASRVPVGRQGHG